MSWTSQVTPATPMPLFADGADGAGDVRAVAVVVHRVAVVVDEVVAVDVVDEAVAVVVDSAVARRLRRGWSRCWRQVGVGVVDAGVDDGDDGAAVAGGTSQASGASMSASGVPPVWPVLFSPHSWRNRDRWEYPRPARGNWG